MIMKFKISGSLVLLTLLGSMEAGSLESKKDSKDLEQRQVGDSSEILRYAQDDGEN